MLANEASGWWLDTVAARPSRALREGGRGLRAWRLRRRYGLVLGALGDLRGARVIDVGGAEGLFAKRLLAAGAAQVTVVEAKQRRCVAGAELVGENDVRFVAGSVLDHLDLFAGCDTLVSLRCIYHMGPAVHELLRAIQASAIRRVALQGRAWLRRHVVPQQSEQLWGPPLGLLPGMAEILAKYGFRPELHRHPSFPVAVGRR